MNKLITEETREVLKMLFNNISILKDKEVDIVKNIKMPKLVYMNLSTLNTLDDRQYFSGFAEVMKHGLIKDAKFYIWLIENMYEICERDLDVLEEMVLRSCTIKKMVVENGSSACYQYVDGGDCHEHFHLKCI